MPLVPRQLRVRPGHVHRDRPRLTRRRIRLALGAVVLLVVLDAVVVLARVDSFDAELPGSGDGGGTIYLLIGSDRRGDVPEADAKRFGTGDEVPGERADVVIALNARPDGTVRTLSIPRDLTVFRAGGGPERLGPMLADGPGAVADALCHSLGIGADHVAVVHFAGLTDLVDLAGGVVIDPPATLLDRNSGLLVAGGRQRADGRTALAYLRARHVERRVGDDWVPDPAESARRGERSMEVLRGLGSAVDLGWNPWHAQRVVWAATGAVTVDDGMGPGDMLALADAVRGLDGDALATLPVDATDGEVPTATANALTGPALEQFLDGTRPAESCGTPALTGDASPSTTVPGFDPVPAAAPQRVIPSRGTLDTIDRDAGIAARLRDGSVLWLFGDTAARRDDGTVEYFQIGTASWASADEPVITHDVAGPGGAPVTFATPTADFPACPEPTQRAGMWPASAIVEPVGDRDRVIVWLHNICLSEGGGLVDRGMALAEWWYDPAHPPVDEPVQATILDQTLFAERSFGTAAVLADDGDVYAYRCDTPAEPSDREGFGPCAVARVPLASVADADAYQVVDDDLELPAGLTDPVPPGGFGVAFDPAANTYVMAYSPWPGSSQVVDVRTSASPVGPWTEPVSVALDGCADRIGTREFNCYAGGPHPAFSSPGRVGIGYYDSSVSTFPTRGAYMVTTIAVADLPQK